MKTLLINISNNLTMCNDEDMRWNQFIYVSFYKFPSFLYFLMNIHLYANDIISM